METICLLHGETTGLSLLLPTACLNIQFRQQSAGRKLKKSTPMQNPFSEYNANMEVLIYLTVSFNLSCANPFQKVVVAFFHSVNKCNCGDCLEIIS